MYFDARTHASLSPIDQHHMVCRRLIWQTHAKNVDSDFYILFPGFTESENLWVRD